MNDKMLMWVWFSEIFGAANPRKWEATSRFDTVEECYHAYKNQDFYGLTQKEIQRVKNVNLDDCKRIIEYCQKNNINIYCYESEGFPQRLMEIYNPPSVLYVKQNTGNLDFLDDSVTISVVGARNADSYSLKVTDEICNKLAWSGAVIISGFAVGVDTAAHKSAIKNGGKTVAVLGSGIDYDYPKGTLSFKDEISKHGAVISEFQPLHKPRETDFKARNRILSGLSVGVLVCEASKRSGALNTVSHGISQGKDIFCIPPRDIFDKKYRGVVQLLRDGATPVYDERDIIFKYYENYSHRINSAKNVMNFSQVTEDSVVFSDAQPVKVKKTKKQTEEIKPQDIAVVVTEELIHDLTDIQKKIVLALEGKSLLLDELSRTTEIGISKLLAQLTELELMDRVKSLPGKRYSL